MSSTSTTTAESLTRKAILEAGRTGDVGDGKMFVFPVEKIYRIRSGEEDKAAVTPAK